MTEPPMMVATSTPKEAASARPSTALPRVTTRSRQSNSELNSAVIIQASNSEGAVKWPSNLLVNRRTGILSRRWENPEIRVGLARRAGILRSPDSRLGHAQVTVEHRSGLKVVEVAVGGCPERVGRT